MSLYFVSIKQFYELNVKNIFLNKITIYVSIYSLKQSSDRMI